MRSCIINEQRHGMQKLIGRTIVGESASWERIFNFGCKFRDRPAERQSWGRLAGEAIKLQFHGLTPRKATRGETRRYFIYHFPSRTSRSSRDCITARDALNPITNNKAGRKGGSYAPLDERKNVVSDPISPLVVRVIYRASCASVRSRCLYG